MARRIKVKVFYNPPDIRDRDFGGLVQEKWILEASDTHGRIFLHKLREYLTASASAIYTTEETVTKLVISDR